MRFPEHFYTGALIGILKILGHQSTYSCTHTHHYHYSSRPRQTTKHSIVGVNSDLLHVCVWTIFLQTNFISPISLAAQHYPLCCYTQGLASIVSVTTGGCTTRLEPYYRLSLQIRVQSTVYSLPRFSELFLLLLLSPLLFTISITTQLNLSENCN